MAGETKILKSGYVDIFQISAPTYNGQPIQDVIANKNWKTAAVALCENGEFQQADSLEDLQNRKFTDKSNVISQKINEVGILNISNSVEVEELDLTILNLGWDTSRKKFCFYACDGIKTKVYMCVTGRNEETDVELKSELDSWISAFRQVLRLDDIDTELGRFKSEENIYFEATVLFFKGGKIFGGMWKDRRLTLSSDEHLRLYEKDKKLRHAFSILNDIKDCRSADQIRRRDVDLCSAVKFNQLIAIDLLGKKHPYYIHFQTKEKAKECRLLMKKLSGCDWESRLQTSPSKRLYVAHPTNPKCQFLLPYELQAVLSYLNRDSFDIESSFLVVLTDQSRYRFTKRREDLKYSPGSNIIILTADGKESVVHIKREYINDLSENMKRELATWPLSVNLVVNVINTPYIQEVLCQDFTREPRPLVHCMDPKKPTPEPEKNVTTKIRRHVWEHNQKPKVEFSRYYDKNGVPNKVTPPVDKAKKPSKDPLQQQWKMMEKQQKYIDKENRKMMKRFQNDLEENMEDCYLDDGVVPNSEQIPGVSNLCDGAYMIDGCL